MWWCKPSFLTGFPQACLEAFSVASAWICWRAHLTRIILEYIFGNVGSDFVENNHCD